ILFEGERPEETIHKQMAGRPFTSTFHVVDRPFEDCISIDEIMLLHPVPLSSNDPGNLGTLLTLKIPEAFREGNLSRGDNIHEGLEILDRSGEGTFPDKEQREHIPVFRDDQ